MPGNNSINVKTLADLQRRIGELGTLAGDTAEIEDLLLIAYQAIDSTSSGIAITDLDSIIIYVNDSFVRMFGYKSADDVTGRNISTLFLSEKIRSFKDIEKVVDASEEDAEEFIVQRRDGGLFHVEVYPSKILNRKKAPVGRMFSFKNISKRKVVEEKLLYSEEQLKISNAAKDKLFSIIAHDLRNALGNIMVYEELFQEGSIDRKDVLDFLKHFFSSAGDAVNLMDNLLKWAKNQLEHVYFKPSICNITQIIRENVELIKPASEKKKILVRLVKAGDVSAYFDPDMISTVIRNLLSNAVKFTPEKGKIRLSVARKENLVEVSVSNSGEGLSAEKFGEILRPDLFISTRGTNGEKGTGLGLKLCKEFLEKNGGSIALESRPGMGATFRFTLPGMEK